VSGDTPEGFNQWLVAGVANPRIWAIDLATSVGPADRREIDEVHTVREVVLQTGRDRLVRGASCLFPPVP
jgi:hypothetical protein